MRPLRDCRKEIIGALISVVDISSRKQAEEKLLAASRRTEEALALLDTLQTGAPIGLGFVDRHFRYVRCNGALAEINGLTQEDHIGRCVWEVVPRLWPQLEGHYEQVRSGRGPIVNQEVVGETSARPGVARTWHVSYYPVTIREEIIGTGIVVSEITERKRVEEALRASEARSGAILRALPDMMFHIKADGTIVDYSASNLDDLYVPPSEFVGKRVDKVLPSPLCGLILDKVRQTLESQQSQLFEYDLDIPRKGKQWFEARMVPNGERETFSIVRNITERKSAETTIEQERRQLAGIINSSMDGIITIDESERIVIFNAAAEKIFQCRAADMIGRRIAPLIPERFRSLHSQHVRRFGGADLPHFEMGKGRAIAGLRSTGEEFPIEASISQTILNGRKFFTLTCRDMTERARAEETRRKLESQLLQSQKMEAIGLLAGGVAHDFNNLLTVIASYTELLIEALASNEELCEPARAIKEASKRAASLTRQLLVFSRQHVSDAVVLNLNALVSESEKMLRRLIGEDIRITTSLDPAIGSVKADPAQLNQVLMNLALNARDAMPKGGTLSIETRSLQGDCGLKGSTGAVLLAVADTGVGMTPDVASRVFEPFFTTKGVGKGTGLGLSVVHGIVEQSGGRIEMASQPGCGTTFQIYLPVHNESPAERELPELSALPRGSETILLVEDDEAVRRLAVLSLTTHGYRVVSAVDGQDALRVLEECPDGDDLLLTIDLLLTDVVMPNLDGLDLARMLRVRLPGLRILFMSGYSGDAITQRSMSHEDISLLQKPYTPAALVRKVREVLDHVTG